MCKIEKMVKYAECDPIAQSIYKEVQTPYEYGIVLHSSDDQVSFDCNMVDSMFAFGLPGDNEYVYMTYIGHDGDMDKGGYRTGLARSKDMLSWEKLGVILDINENSGWDKSNAAGYLIRDSMWGSLPIPHVTANGKYAMTYLASSAEGYENGIKKEGVAFTDAFFMSDGRVKKWMKNPMPILDASDGKYSYENGIIWKMSVVWDEDNKQYAGFYNASSGPEVMCQAYSRDLLSWTREEANPVLATSQDKGGNSWGASYNGDANVVKIGDYWVMFYFTDSPAGIIDTFAYSKDMVHWTKSYIPLTARNDTYSCMCAHKCDMIKHNGVVYHYYCAVGKAGRQIAVSTSVDLTVIKEAEKFIEEHRGNAGFFAKYGAVVKKTDTLRHRLTERGGNLARVTAAIADLKAEL